MVIDEKKKALLNLSVYGELSAAQEEELRSLLESNPDLQLELKSLEELLAFLKANAPQASDRLLWQARQNLNRALRMVSNEASPQMVGRKSHSRISGLLGAFLHPVQAVAAVLLLGAGIAVGFIISGSSQPGLSTVDPFSQPGVRVSGVRFRELSSEAGRVEVDFEAARTFRLTGSVDDAKIRRFLSYALISERNPAVRLRAISTITSQPISTHNGEIQSALIGALKTDTNVAVRREALQALKKFPMDASIKASLVYVLQYDPNARLRIEAINMLEPLALSGQTLDSEVVKVLQDKVNNDQNDYIRSRARLVLQGAGRDYF